MNIFEQMLSRYEITTDNDLKNPPYKRSCVNCKECLLGLLSNN